MSRNTSEIDTKKDEIIRIGDLAYSPDTQQFAKANGSALELRNQSEEVLRLLVATPSEVVSKESLFERVWGEVFVTDDSLVQCISDIRKAVGVDGHQLIQTVPKKGYRLNLAAQQLLEPSSFSTRNFKSIWKYAVIAAALVLGLFAWNFYQSKTEVSSRDETKPRIAVLPFDDFSAGADKGYLSDAIVEGIITELARSRVYSVIARNSSFKFRGTDKDVREIGEDLGVHYVLEGSQQKNGDALKVTAQLIDAKNGEHIWAHTYDQKIGDLFVVQDKIVRTLADRVDLKISRPLPLPDQDKVTALHLNLMARAQIQKEFNAENNYVFLVNGKKAIEVDPDSHFGYMALMFYYRHAATFGWDNLDHDEAIKLGLENGNKALAIAPDDPEVHYGLARLYSEAGDIEASNAKFTTAIGLNPSASNFLVASTTPMLYVGQKDEAIARLEQAMGIDPFHPDWYHWQMGWALWEKEQCGDALASMKRMKVIHKGAQRMLAGIYGCLGDVENAQKAYQTFYTDSKELTVSEQREEWKDNWTAPGSLERFLKHMKIAGMKE